jgi:hypothetical protein
LEDVVEDGLVLFGKLEHGHQADFVGGENYFREVY